MDVFGTMAITLPAAALFTILGAVYAREAKVDERVDVAIGVRPDAAAAPAVTTIRAAARNVFLAPERHSTITALAGDHFDTRFVNEFHGRSVRSVRTVRIVRIVRIVRVR